jgi:hypothetical protein
MVRVVKAVQLSHKLVPMVLTPVPIVILVKAEQFANTLLPSVVTELGMTTLVKSVHPLNAFVPIRKTLDAGKVMLVIAKPLNTPEFMPVIVTLYKEA